VTSCKVVSCKVASCKVASCKVASCMGIRKTVSKVGQWNFTDHLWCNSWYE
jgi:hypothetical protein